MIRAETLELKVTAIDQGDPVALPSVDSVGWTRQPAPFDGLLVEYGTMSALVPLTEIRKQLNIWWKRRKGSK